MWDSGGYEVTRVVTIPSLNVTLDLRQGGRGVGIGMFSQVDDRLDVAWDSVFNGIVYPNRFYSRMMAANGGRSRVVIVECLDYADVGVSQNPGFEVFLKAWTKKLVQEYATSDYEYTTFIGTARPGTQGTVVFFLYSPLNLTDGLPQHCTGIYIPYGRSDVYRFGTTSYSWWFASVVSDTPQTGALTYVSNSIITSAANLGMTLKKSGKVVTLNATSTTVAGVSASSLVTVANLPSGFYPSGVNAVVTAPQQATTAGNIISLYATTDGLLRVIKIGTSTAAWRATLTWLTE